MNTVPYKKYNTFASVQKSTVPWHFNSTLHVNVLAVQLQYISFTSYITWQIQIQNSSIQVTFIQTKNMFHRS